jgi:DnaJ-class molecular chaperone
MRDPYEILGVARSASEGEIKKAFRTLAKKHHPDPHGSDAGAKKRFQEISGAYDILGDKDKRAKFDAGEIDAGGSPRGFDPRAQRGSPFGGGANPRDFNFTWDNAQGGGGGFRAEDIFADFFGGRRARTAHPQAQKGADFSVAVTVAFAEAATGGTRRVVLQNGEQIDVKIPVGVKDGQAIRVKGRGGAGIGGGPAGDILIQVSVAPHPYLTRDGNDLKMDLPVTLKEAVLGGKVPVPTLTGAVALSVPPNANTGATLRLKGKGIPAHGGQAAGDLYVRLSVVLPDKPDEALRKFLQTWQTSYDPRLKMR